MFDRDLNEMNENLTGEHRRTLQLCVRVYVHWKWMVVRLQHILSTHNLLSNTIIIKKQPFKMLLIYSSI